MGHILDKAIFGVTCKCYSESHLLSSTSSVSLCSGECSGRKKKKKAGNVVRLRIQLEAIPALGTEAERVPEHRGLPFTSSLSRRDMQAWPPARSSASVPHDLPRSLEPSAGQDTLLFGPGPHTAHSPLHPNPTPTSSPTCQTPAPSPHAASLGAPTTGIHLPHGASAPVPAPPSDPHATCHLQVGNH